MDKDQLLDELRSFYGTERYYRANPGLLVTDGVEFLADNAGCYWLLDMVWSYLPVLRKSRDTFFVVRYATRSSEQVELLRQILANAKPEVKSEIVKLTEERFQKRREEM